MAIVVRAAGAPEAMEDLDAWLRADPRIARHAELRRVRPPGAGGTMGGGLEALQLVVGSGFNLATLVLSYLAWRTSRAQAGQPVRVVIEHGTRTTAADDASPGTARRMRRDLGVDGGDGNGRAPGGDREPGGGGHGAGPAGDGGDGGDGRTGPGDGDRDGEAAGNGDGGSGGAGSTRGGGSGDGAA